MMELDSQLLTFRLERLERGQRVWKMIAMGSLAVIGLVVLLGATGTKIPAEIRAKRFILMDGEGKTRGMLGFSEHHEPRLVLFDQDGRRRAGLGLLPDGSPRLILSDKDGKNRLGVMLEPDGLARMSVSDRTGQQRIGMAVAPNGMPVLGITDTEGKPRLSLGVTLDDAAELTFQDRSGKTRMLRSMYSGPHSKLIDVPAPQGAPLPGKRRSTTLLPQEVQFLYEYTHSGNIRAALEAAEYHPATDALARDMANEILRKVNEAMDCRDALTAAGMGTAEWVRCLYGLAHEENPKWRIAALKLWGLALGMFSERPQGMGASILLGGKTDPQGQQAAVGMRIQWPSRRRDALGPVPAGDDPQLTPSAEG